MKKSLFFALAVAGMLAGCSSNESFDGGSYTENNDDADYSGVPIQIGVSRIAALDVRGTGTVGDIEGGANNVWRGQSINVLMFEKNSLNLAIKDKELNKWPIYNCTEFETPNGSISEIATDALDSIKYYPQRGNFDFWGYRLDGADEGLDQPEPQEVAEAAEYTFGYEGEEFVKDDKTSKIVGLNFAIDGTQDVMIAKAAPSEEDLNDRAAASARAYSAYSARNGVQPELIFKHLLTRLNFQVKAGDENAVGNNDPEDTENTGIWVKSIAVKSKSTGKLIVAYTGEEIADADRIVWTPEQELIDMTLRSRNPEIEENPINSNLLNTLTATQPESTTEATQLGEAMLVAPADQYDLVITLYQYKPEIEGGDPVEKEFTVPATITTEGGFLLGHSYNVVVTLFGMQKIEITTTLTGWVNGGEDIDITPEDNIE